MKALILTNDAELKSRLTRLLSNRVPSVGVAAAVPGMLPDAVPVTAIKPDLVFFEADGDEEQRVAQLERAAKRYPQVPIVLMTSSQSSSLLVAAMRMGVREVVALPLSEQEVEGAIERISQKIREIQQRHGKILSLISCKGGSGTTFIAANLSHALAASAHQRVLLIDLGLQFGDAALYVSDVQPRTTLTDVCSQMNRLDADLLDSSLLKVTPDFGILAAPESPDPDNTVRPEQLEVILQLAKKHYDFVLVDLGRQVNALTVRALDMSDFIYPVLQQSLPFLRNGRRLLDMFSALGYRKEKIRLIANRIDNSAGVGLADMERTLGNPIAHQIPNNFELASDSINQGVPVLQLARGSNLSKALVEFANSLTVVPQASSPGIIRRLFVRNATATN